MPDWDLEYDFINLGAGIGGATAAITAREAGLSTVILEKSDQVGGVAAYSGGQLWVPDNHVAEREGIEDNWKDAVTYLNWYSEETADPHMLRAFCKNAREALRFLEERAGVKWCLVALPDNRWPEGPGAIEAGRFVELHPFDGNTLDPRWKPFVR